MAKHFTILGGQGYIGSYFAKYLDRLGIEYWIPKRDVRSLFERDLGCVIYSIGMTQDFARNPIETMDAHVANLVSFLRRARLQSLIYLSSTRLFDGLQGIVSEQSNLHLNPENPRHLFDLSKAAGEALCCAMTNVDATAVRLSTLYDDDLAGQCFVHDILKRSLASSVDTIEVETSLDIERDYIHIDDVCDALLYLSVPHSHRVYNLGSGVNVSNRQLFEMIQNYTGRSFRPTRNGIAATPVLDISRMKNEFGWSPRPISDWIGAIIEKSKGADFCD
jgi:nucleoside-diphosphate-sugar epimerase